MGTYKKTDWVMIRVQRALKDKLIAFGLSMVDHPLKEQGNHENNQADGPPLWWVIEQLLERESKHRGRGKTNSVPKRFTAPREVKYGLPPNRPLTDVLSDGDVYIAPPGSDEATKADDCCPWDEQGRIKRPGTSNQ